LISEGINDAPNGKYKGWAYTASLTERNTRAQISKNYVHLDSEDIAFAINDKEKPF
jgi:hypothetical protein